MSRKYSVRAIVMLATNEARHQKSKNAQGPLGGHAVKILGWGTENNMNYLLTADGGSCSVF